jgi:hypothetical protein
MILVMTDHPYLRVGRYNTFSHVVKLATIRLILSLTVSQGWPLQQLDV